MVSLEEKTRQLHALLQGYGRVAIGFSGGVDSTLLVRMAMDVLGVSQVLAVIADTPSLPRKELSEALKLAQGMGATCLVVDPDELSDPAYAANPVDRCYFCKRALFRLIIKVAGEKGFVTVLDGNNADDVGDYRPGRRAVQELGVQSPLMEAGLTKDDIRKLSARVGLPTAEKPAMACLASRIPYGTPVTIAVLAQIERAEKILHQQGFMQCRVRHHGEVARIEVLPNDLPSMLDKVVREAVVQGVKEAGYRYVTLDLQGYRIGSLNEGVADLIM